MEFRNLIAVLSAVVFSQALGPAVSFGQTSTEAVGAQVRELSGTLHQTESPEKPVKLGEPFQIDLKVVHEPGVDVVIPSTFGSDRWELLSADKSVIESETEWTTNVALRFAVFRPGETTLAPFPIELVSSDGEGVLRSKPIRIKAVSILEDDTEEFTAPRPPVIVWVEDNTLLLVGGFGASALLLGLFFFAARRRREDDEVLAPPRPAHEVALEKLGRLAGDNMVERGEYMVFYVMLSEAIREYLGRRYGFKAVEMTTTEILDALEQAKVSWPDSVSHDDVRQFLLHCDSVKFGGAIPSAETASERLRRAFSIVEATRPQGLPVVEAQQPSQEASPEEEPPVADDSRWMPPEVAADSDINDSETGQDDDSPEEERDGE